uniref:Uncharacterized protein n=1 Tax=Arundo donax TaxID=35708 RepID=A0A0A8YK51_ARUDO
MSVMMKGCAIASLRSFYTVEILQLQEAV